MLCLFSSKGQILSSDSNLHGTLLVFSSGTRQQHLGGATACLTLSHVRSAHCGEIADSEQNLISWKLLVYNHQQRTRDAAELPF